MAASRSRNRSRLASAVVLTVALVSGSVGATGTSVLTIDAAPSSLIQNDAESGGDAPDDCVSDEPSELDLISTETYGQLVQPEDPRDVFTLIVREGEAVDIIQKLPDSGDKKTSIHLPHAPLVPHVDEDLAHDDENPFALQVLDSACTVVATSDDPSTLPRTVTLVTEGVYQVMVYESGGTDVAGTKTGDDAMCHPPCFANGYLVEHLPV